MYGHSSHLDDPVGDHILKIPLYFEIHFVSFQSFIVNANENNGDCIYLPFCNSLHENQCFMGPHYAFIVIQLHMFCMSLLPFPHALSLVYCPTRKVVRGYPRVRGVTAWYQSKSRV